MRIIIDIGHPGHVHLFRPFTKEMTKRGHVIFFTCRQKEFEIELLKASAFDYKCFGRHYKSFSCKIWGLVTFNIQMIFIAMKFKPDIFLSHGSIYAAHVSFLIRKPHISFEDTYNFEQIRLYKPFTSCMLTGNYPHPRLSNKEINYSGFHELAYLHPKRFNFSIISGQEILGLDKDEKYIILRFVSWEATHDKGNSGFTNQMKHKVVGNFLKYSRVFISSEKELSMELEKYKLAIKPEMIHYVLKDAVLVFGESATMATEAAMLGTPGIFIDNNSRFYMKELEEKYGLVFNFTATPVDQEKALQKGLELLQNKNLKNHFMKRRNNMLKDKIDVTGFLVWFIINYPDSVSIMKGNPDYQTRFK